LNLLHYLVGGFQLCVWGAPAAPRQAGVRPAPSP